MMNSFTEGFKRPWRILKTIGRMLWVLIVMLVSMALAGLAAAVFAVGGSVTVFVMAMRAYCGWCMDEILVAYFKEN